MVKLSESLLDFTQQETLVQALSYPTVFKNRIRSLKGMHASDIELGLIDLRLRMKKKHYTCIWNFQKNFSIKLNLTQLLIKDWKLGINTKPKTEELKGFNNSFKNIKLVLQFYEEGFGKQERKLKYSTFHKKIVTITDHRVVIGATVTSDDQ